MILICLLRRLRLLRLPGRRLWLPELLLRLYRLLLLAELLRLCRLWLRLLSADPCSAACAEFVSLHDLRAAV